MQTKQPQAIACCRESFVELVPYTNRSVHFNHEWATKFRSEPVDRRGNNLKICIARKRDGERDRVHCLNNCTRAFSTLSRKPGTSHAFVFSNRSCFRLLDPSLKFTFVLPGSMCEDLLNKQRRCCAIKGASFYSLTKVFLLLEDSVRVLWFQLAAETYTRPILTPQEVISTPRQLNANMNMFLQFYG